MRDVLLTAALNAANAPPVPFFYGGQAVIEGVLMRGRSTYAIAARRPDGTITICREVLNARMYTHPVWSRPLLRGVGGLAEMLHLGLRALTWSANIQLGEDVEIGAGTMRVTVATSIAFALGLFIGLPLLLGQILHRGGSQSLGRVLIEGVIRACLILAYLTVIGQFRTMRRVFEYHGAEHKAINCLEEGDVLDVPHVAGASRLHPRCGTGFIVVVALVSVIVFAPLAVLPLLVRLLLQIALVPLVASVSYEVIRALTRIRRTPVGRSALVPILAAQRLTTREPDSAQMEVAIAALEAVRAREDGSIGEVAGAPA